VRNYYFLYCKQLKTTFIKNITIHKRMELTFLGTSCMVPTKERNVQSIYLEYKGEGILIDCGEGTQRQMSIIGKSRMKVKKVLISHWHGDHVSGLIGLIQTLGNQEEPKKLTVFGPKGTKTKMYHLLNSCYFDLRIQIDVKEIDTKKKSIVYQNQDYKIEAAPMEHSVPCLGYSFIEKDQRKINMAKAKKLGLKEGPDIGKLQRGQKVKGVKPEQVSHIQKGKKITFILDTRPCKNAIELAEDADLLICEAAYMKKHEEKGIEYSHMTTEQAAYIANKANVKKLIITHFSQRYKTTEELAEEIKTYFKNSSCAYDFMKLKV
jgi:ribonuclease Z